MTAIFKKVDFGHVGTIAAAGAFAAEALRRKKEREQQIEDYHHRPRVEAEGKGGRMTGNQIARAYQAAKNAFTATLQKAQAMGMSAEQAAQLNDEVAKSGKIGGALSAAKDYIAQKEQERAERAATYRAWRVEETTYTPPTEPPVTPAQPQMQAAEAYQHFRAQEREGYNATAGQVQKTSLWQRIADKGTAVIQSLATAIGAVEIARYAHFLEEKPPSEKIGRSLKALWNNMRYQAEKWNYNWERVQSTLEELRRRTALAIQKTIESSENWRTKIKKELQAHWTSFTGQAKMTWDALRRNGLSGLKIKAGDLIEFSGSVSDLTSAASYAAYVVTGNEKAKTVGDWSQVAGIPAGIKQIWDGVKMLQRTPKVSTKAVSFLGKVAGPLAIGTGLVDAGRGIYSLTQGEARDGKVDNKDIQAWADIFAGAAAFAGGVALLIPGAQPVAAVAFGFSTVASGVSIVAEHWSAIHSFFTRPAAYPGMKPAPPAVTQTGTPAPLSTSTPTPTPTLPSTNTATTILQGTQTPTPPQTSNP